MENLKKAVQEIEALEVGDFVVELDPIVEEEAYKIRTKTSNFVISTNLLFEVLGKYPNIYSFAGSDKIGTYIAIW